MSRSTFSSVIPSRRIPRTVLAGVVVTATVASLSACSSDDGGNDVNYEGTVGSTDLSAVCPANIVVQTDWFPEAEHGHLYQQIVGGDGTVEDAVIDSDSMVVSGPLFDGDNGYTGVDIEIRSGGPAIGYQNVTSQLYQDPDIFMGYVDTDQSIQQSDAMPTIGVMNVLEKSPQMIMWDPETYPEVEEIADLKETGATVLTFPDMSYIDFLTGSGILDEAQIDSSYDGAPATFVAAGGENAQQGYSSSEPYKYENEVDGWMKPVKYQLLHDAGFETYKSPLAVKADDLESKSECLSELVPVLQRGVADYLDDPAEANELIVQAVDDFDGGWVYGPESAVYGHETLIREGLQDNGPSGYLGEFDENRVEGLIEMLTPIFDEQGTPVREGLTPEDVATNEFLDTDVSR